MKLYYLSNRLEKSVNSLIAIAKNMVTVLTPFKLD